MKYDIKRYRDLSIVSLDEEKYLVIATDSCGSIGEKENDTVKLDIATVVENTARVAILEVMSVNASIVNVIDSLTFERNYYGERVIERLYTLLDELGLDKAALNGTTEDIWPTKESGVVVTVIGVVTRDKIRMKKLCGNESVYLFGQPLIGENVTDTTKRARLSVAQKVARDKSVSEMLPIGSRGISREANALMEEYGYQCHLIEDPMFDSPGGPATCFLAFSEEDLTKKYSDCRMIGYISKQGDKSEQSSILG